MQLTFLNTASRRPEVFEPLDGKTVRLYTCGPTVYNFAHIGNFRAYVFEDILVRALKYAGYDVRQIMNLTDVDDKTIRGCGGRNLHEYTKPFVAAFFEDLKALNITPAERYPAATDHIAEMIELISRLFEKGLAYRSDDGSVYFNVGKFENYGHPAHIDTTGMRGGARVAQDEYEKESVGDFALWKAWDEADGEIAWDSPWGKGRPGWHIECSAMSMKYLGETFDIHTGGVDNLFPHHANETAQAEGATGKPFVKTWLHCAHLRVNGEKMSKSLGNFFTLRDLLAKGWTGREIRYVLINCQYRQTLNFSEDALAAARVALGRIDAFVERMESAAKAQTGDAEKVALSGDSAAKFESAIGDDLNIPNALAAVFTMIREANKVPNVDTAALLAQLRKFDEVLGVIFFGKDSALQAAEIPAEIEELLEKRSAARAAKNWGLSDTLRDEIAALGWSVKDTKEGQKVSRNA